MNINYYNPYVQEELMLYHYGRPGQRWGRRNGPPYPLGAGQLSAAEKRARGNRSKDYSKRNASLASKYKAKSDKHYQKMLDVYEKHHEYADRGKDKKADKYWDKMVKHRTKMFKYDKMKKRFEAAKGQKISRFTPEQKAKAKKIAIKALKIAGAIAIAALLGYGAYRGAAYLQGARGAAKAAKRGTSFITENIIKENVVKGNVVKGIEIKENVITENVITENIIRESKIIENLIKR